MVAARMEPVDMSSSLFTRLGLLALVLGAGCFAEFAPEGSPAATVDPTAEQSCTPGALACDCYGNGTCDPELECVAEISTCVPAGCTAGSRHCVCDGGACDGELTCDAGLCVEVDSASSGGGGSEDTAGAASSEGPSATTDGESGELPDGTESSSGSESGPTSVSGSDSDTDAETGEVACGEQTCGECVVCAVQQAAGCAGAAEQCEDAVGCQSAAACLASCGVKGLCLDDCCDGLSPAAVDAALTLNACRADTCAAACGDYNIGQCG